MNKKLINISKFISSPMAISPDDGEKLFEEIYKALKEKAIANRKSPIAQNKCSLCLLLVHTAKFIPAKQQSTKTITI